MPDDVTMNDTQDPEIGPKPELADWWVWGVRKIAAMVADLMLAARPMAILVVLLKGAMWVLTRDIGELWGAGGGVAAFFALWGGGLLLGRFSAEQDTPDPERWFMRQRRGKGR